VEVNYNRFLFKSYIFYVLVLFTQVYLIKGTLDFEYLFRFHMDFAAIIFLELIPFISYLILKKQNFYIVKVKDEVNILQKQIADKTKLEDKIRDKELGDEKFRVLYEQSTNAHLIFDDTGIIDCINAAIDMLKGKNKA